LAELGHAKVSIAQTLGVSEGTVRYHIKHPPDARVDGRAKTQKAAALAGVIAYWRSEQKEGYNLTELHEYLAANYGYAGSLRSVQRYWKRTYPEATVFTRRRVETPAGVQGQVDWGVYSSVTVSGTNQRLYALHLTLSRSRYPAIVWSTSKNQLAWHTCHIEALRRVGGVPATLRVDNEKTAIVKGAGAWGVINPAYRRFSNLLSFHVDACPPRWPQAKGKVERLVLTGRMRMDPSAYAWQHLDELQEWTDEHIERAVRRMRCPALDATILEAWQDERPLLTPLPEPLWAPFDVSVTRPVGIDCMVSFEGRQYSVPFTLAEERVEVHGCAETVQFFHDGAMVSEHPRRTQDRILIDPSHYNGTSTERVKAPPPLGRMGKRIMELAAEPVTYRSIDYYQALAEVAR